MSQTIIIKMGGKDIYQNSSKKHPQKNYRDGFGDYCCIPGCQSAFYDANRVKTDIAIFELPKHPALRQKWLLRKLLKDIGVLEELTDLVKRKMSWFVNFILTQSRFWYLWEDTGRHIYQKVHRRCLNLNLRRRKRKENQRKPPKSRNNQETSGEFETESESSDSQCYSDVSNSVVDFPEDIDNTSKLRAENESLRCKIGHLELENIAGRKY